MDRLTVLVFSKDRPLQLCAYLSSLMHYANIPQSCITVLYKEVPPIMYGKLLERFPGIHWWAETKFQDDLATIANNARNYILFGCDDVVYLDYWLPMRCMDMLAARPDVASVNLRCGVFNMNPPIMYDDAYLKEWGMLHTWQQCWETGSSLFRKADVLRVLVTKPNPDFKIDNAPYTLVGDTIGAASETPNFLEALGHRNQAAWLTDDRHHIACYEQAKAIAFSVNVVQNKFNNQWDSSQPFTPQELYKAWLAGKMLDWRRLNQWKCYQVHVGSKEFKLA